MSGKAWEGDLGQKRKNGWEEGQGGRRQGRDIWNQGDLLVPCLVLRADLPPNPLLGMLISLTDVKPANDPILKPS